MARRNKNLIILIIVPVIGILLALFLTVDIYVPLSEDDLDINLEYTNIDCDARSEHMKVVGRITHVIEEDMVCKATGEGLDEYLIINKNDPISLSDEAYFGDYQGVTMTYCCTKDRPREFRDDEKYRLEQNPDFCKSVTIQKFCN